MSKCYIITSYVLGSLSSLLDNETGDLVICADGGYLLAAENGLIPDLVIGDFDSMKSDLPVSIKAVRLPVEKDVTDTLACVKYAIDKGFKEIVIIGGTGGRLDHTMANLQCLNFAALNGIAIELRDEKNIASIHLPSEIRVKRNLDFKLSIFAFSERCDGVTLSGLKYPLADFTLEQNFPVGISNEFIADYADISFTSGVLLLILSRD